MQKTASLFDKIAPDSFVPWTNNRAKKKEVDQFQLILSGLPKSSAASYLPPLKERRVRELKMVKYCKAFLPPLTLQRHAKRLANINSSILLLQNDELPKKQLLMEVLDAIKTYSQIQPQIILDIETIPEEKITATVIRCLPNFARLQTFCNVSLGKNTGCAMHHIFDIIHTHKFEGANLKVFLKTISKADEAALETVAQELECFVGTLSTHQFKEALLIRELIAPAERTQGVLKGIALMTKVSAPYYSQNTLCSKLKELPARQLIDLLVHFQQSGFNKNGHLASLALLQILSRIPDKQRSQAIYRSLFYLFGRLNYVEEQHTQPLVNFLKQVPLEQLVIILDNYLNICTHYYTEDFTNRLCILHLLSKVKEPITNVKNQKYASLLDHNYNERVLYFWQDTFFDAYTIDHYTSQFRFEWLVSKLIEMEFFINSQQSVHKEFDFEGKTYQLQSTRGKIPKDSGSRFLAQLTTTDLPELIPLASKLSKEEEPWESQDRLCLWVLLAIWEGRVQASILASYIKELPNQLEEALLRIYIFLPKFFQNLTKFNYIFLPKIFQQAVGVGEKDCTEEIFSFSDCLKAAYEFLDTQIQKHLELTIQNMQEPKGADAKRYQAFAKDLLHKHIGLNHVLGKHLQYCNIANYFRVLEQFYQEYDLNLLITMIADELDKCAPEIRIGIAMILDQPNYGAIPAQQIAFNLLQARKMFSPAYFIS